MVLSRCLSARQTRTAVCRTIVHDGGELRCYSVESGMSLAIYFFGLLPIPVLVCIAVVMYRRKQHFLYSVFWTYVLFQLLRVSAEFICKFISYKAFFYSYWIASFGSVVFTLLLLRDIFKRVLKNYSALGRVRRIGYETALICLWGAASLLVFRIAPAHGLLRRITRTELIVSFTAVGMFVFVVAASIILGIKWRSAVCGMAAGLGLLGTIDLLVFAALSRASELSHHSMLAGWIETLGFNLAIGVFAVYFLPLREKIDLPRKVKPELLGWVESMKRSLPK
jgi:hypothetical protein